MNIITNHHYRLLLSWHDLTDAEQREHADAYDGVKDSTFFRYRGQVYDLGEFSRPAYLSHERSMLNKWHGMLGTSFFSAVLVKYSDDYESVKIGLALS